MTLQSANPPSIITLNEWKGLNQQSRRASIDDQEEWWNENFFAIGPGNLRTCWGHGPAIYTAPPGTQILRIFFGFIGYPTPQFAAPGPQYGGRLGWMFLDNGHIVQVDLDNHDPPVDIGQIWEPIAPYYWGSAVVWRPRFFGSVAGQVGGVLFGSPQGYYAWDGTNLYSPGDLAPDWLTDQAETDTMQPPTIMPVGLPGIYCMEVFEERVFVAGKDVISFSAPSNGADFSTINGGGSFGYFGNKLVYSYMDLAASAGYLYVFGDSSTDVVSNIQLSGSGTIAAPFVTDFNYANVDPQVGQGFPRPVGRIGRHFVHFNRHLIFLTTGGDAQPVGDKVSQLHMTLDTSRFLPTAATATMFGFRVVLINGEYTDPWGNKRSMLLMWHPGERITGQGRDFWSVASQDLDLTHIGHYEQDSIIRPYGTDGTSLYELFAVPDPVLVKRLSTKALRGEGPAQLSIKNLKRLYCEIHDHDGRGVDLIGTCTTSDGGIPNGSEQVGFSLTAGKVHSIEPQPVAGSGISAHVDLQSNSPDFTIERLHVAAEERTLFGA